MADTTLDAGTPVANDTDATTTTKAPSSGETTSGETTVTNTPNDSINEGVANVNVDEGVESNQEDANWILKIILPSPPGSIELTVSPHEQVHDIRSAITEYPVALQYSCFHLEYNGERVNDFIHVSEIKDIGTGSSLHLVEDPYSEKEARLHMVRVRELIGASGDRTDLIQGILPGLSLFEQVAAECGDVLDKTNQKLADIGEYDFNAVPSISALLPVEQEPAPKTVKGIQLSSWNPPPAHLKQKGHLLYIVVTTMEGEQFQITSHVGGFFVNQSSNQKFDPQPRLGPKGHSAHSLLTLLGQISPSFNESFTKLQDHNNGREPLATFQITNAIPSAPWVVPSAATPLCAHVADITRTQEVFLIAGAEGTDSLRDWNEEFQSAKELPRATVQDRVFRERLLAKLYADYNDAAARGAVMVARGEVAALNPTEGPDAQIFVYNNVFFSFGADGVGTFTSEGGDEAARVATAKDVAGVKAVNQLDVEGIYTPGTVVVDYLGKRIVGQSIVPGIFKQREPGENQIDYGAIDGKDMVAADPRFAAPFAKLSQAMKVKKHPVWDKDGKRFDLEASVETKGLMGTDGRKYILDLYRITPLDINWLEERDGEDKNAYPHRMTVLRQELVELYHRQQLREWLNVEIAKRAGAKNDSKAVEASQDTAATENTNGKPVEGSEDKPTTNGNEPSTKGDEKSEGKTEEKVDGEEVTKEDTSDRIDANDFKFALNPDAFSGQNPQTDEEKAELEADEKAVRAACDFLREVAIPDLLKDLKDSEASFPMDGASLRNLLHKRGINMRYLGRIAIESEKEGSRLDSMREICVRDMIVRSFKHIAAKYLRYLPLPLTSACIAHLLNCLLGTAVNPNPSADVDPSLRKLYSETEMAFDSVTPVSLKQAIEEETQRRFCYKLAPEWQSELRHLQVLREICLKLGLQVLAKAYAFTAEAAAAAPTSIPATATTNGHSETKRADESNKKKKNKKKSRDGSPSSLVSAPGTQTFCPDDIVNVVPIVKDSAPTSSLAIEALEAGRISIGQGNRELGQELLLESLSLHEQIHGILHPEVARVYHQLSMIYFQLDEKDAAVELARKAILVAERTIGVDAQETLLDYLNLALFLHQLGDSRTAYEYSKHALKLWKTIYGPDHPDTITTMNNAAVMLQHLKAFHESRRWFEESLRVCDKIFGASSINSATLQFQLAQALALDNDSRAAVKRMQESYKIFKHELGADDKNTKEAESWLSQLTQNALYIAKRNKQLQTMAPPTKVQAKIVGAAGESSSSREGQPRVDSRSVEELMNFINGKDKKTGKGEKKTGRKNPNSRRGGASA